MREEGISQCLSNKFQQIWKTKGLVFTGVLIRTYTEMAKEVSNELIIRGDPFVLS